MLLPEIERQRKQSKDVMVRADVGFANPELYEALEARGVKYAIRIPSNDTLEQAVAELLRRPVGQPSRRPLVRYKSFWYQAESWTIARREVAKVEFRYGELFPRVGFIVTNLEGRKVVVAVTPGARESGESWAAVLRDLRSRGMPCPRLVIGDGHLGIWGGLSQVSPEAAEQRCWNHRLLNILGTRSRAQQAVAKPLLTAIAYAPTRAEAEQRRAAFEAWCHRHGDDRAAAAVSREWERFVTFYRFPREHWRHLRIEHRGVAAGGAPSAPTRPRASSASRTRPP